MSGGNLFQFLPDPGAGEASEALVETPGLRLERIVSHGHATPPGQWYDQARPEWVLLLRGAARLRFEGEPHERPLGPGDWLLIPAGCRHRVEWTAPGEPTVWLAVHFQEAGVPENDSKTTPPGNST